MVKPALEYSQQKIATQLGIIKTFLETVTKNQAELANLPFSGLFSVYLELIDKLALIALNTTAALAKLQQGAPLQVQQQVEMDNNTPNENSNETWAQPSLDIDTLFDELLHLNFSEDEETDD